MGVHSFEFKRNHPDAVVPTRGTARSAGLDLSSVHEVTLSPGQRSLVDTGWKICIPQGYEGQIRPRSGLALNMGVTCLNSPGTIDSDYRGVLGVILINLGDKEVIIPKGSRIAQLVLAEVRLGVPDIVDEFSSVTSRGENGYGSTGY